MLSGKPPSPRGGVSGSKSKSRSSSSSSTIPILPGDACRAKAMLIQTRVSCRGLVFVIFASCQSPSTPRKPPPADDGRPDLDKSSHAQKFHAFSQLRGKNAPCRLIKESPRQPAAVRCRLGQPTVASLTEPISFLFDDQDGQGTGTPPPKGG